MIYLLVIDVSLPIEIQKQHIQFWIRYLKSQIRDSSNLAVILIGNKEDKLKGEIEKMDITEHFELLKNMADITDYLFTSAKEFRNIKKILEFIKKSCMSFLNSKAFEIPKIYKAAADQIKLLREKEVLMIGLK